MSEAVVLDENEQSIAQTASASFIKNTLLDNIEI